MRTSLLDLNIKILNAVALWPKKKLTLGYFLKILFVYVDVYIGAVAIAAAVFRQLIFGIDDLGAVIEGGMDFADIIGMVYMKYWLLKNIAPAKKLVKDIYKFSKFCPMSVILDAEKKVKKYTKIFMGYAIIGNFLNSVLPIFDKASCEQQRPSQYLRERDPCGTTIRGFWPMDCSKFPLLQIIFFIDLHCCFIVTWIGFGVTTLLIGTLIHTIAQLQYCRKLIKELCYENEESSEEVMYEKTCFCIRYHQEIIEYNRDTNKAFSNQMLLHVTLTSFVISIIGFQILTVETVVHSIRFSLHLIGWNSLLFVVCFYGQQLINESTDVAVDAYSTSWYNSSVSIRKNIKLLILRAQRPLTLNAVNIGVMSLGTFLLVLKTAYSYFTLLLNVNY